MLFSFFLSGVHAIEGDSSWLVVVMLELMSLHSVTDDDDDDADVVSGQANTAATNPSDANKRPMCMVS